jgi:penicillin-binding protein 2
MLNTSTSQNKLKLISRRMFILSSLKFAVFISIITRLFYLQISENIKYRSLSDKNRLREWRLPPERGIIEDYFGTKIANNTQTFQLHMIPEEVPNIGELFFRLSKIINFDENQKRSLIKKMKKRKPWETIIISDNLSWSDFSKLNLFYHEIPGIKPIVSVSRKYFDDGSYSHIIGYISEPSAKDLEQSRLLREVNVPGFKIGKNGLERSLNETIIGTSSLQRFEVNVYGKRIKELEFIQGTPGNNFKTTLDYEIQKFTSGILEDKSGSVCVMDIYTGDIVTLVSNPTFNSNKFVHGISEKDWQKLIENKKKPLLNKSISGLYPPGSTIKPLVALSALENDVVSPKLIIQCKGSIEFYGQKYHCWKEKGHGYMNLRSAIKQSCDIYFYEVARRLGVDRLAITSKKFGLGNKVLNQLSEEKNGVVPNTEWKKKNIGANWFLGETLITGIGQGYFQSTPLQLCLMIAQIANGGYKIKPRIIDDKYQLESIISEWRDEFVNKKSNLIKLFENQENVKFLHDALYGATNEPMGTSYRSRNTKKGFIFAGKTGTSQIRTITQKQRELKIKNEDLPYEKRDHSLFVGFAPYKNPRYAISVVIEHGGSGSSTAAPIAKKVLKKVIERHELRKKFQLDLFRDTKI